LSLLVEKGAGLPLHSEKKRRGGKRIHARLSAEKKSTTVRQNNQKRLFCAKRAKKVGK